MSYYGKPIQMSIESFPQGVVILKQLNSSWNDLQKPETVILATTNKNTRNQIQEGSWIIENEEEYIAATGDGAIFFQIPTSSL